MPDKGTPKQPPLTKKQFKEQNMGLIFASGQTSDGEEPGLTTLTLGSPPAFSILKSKVLVQWQGSFPASMLRLPAFHLASSHMLSSGAGWAPVLWEGGFHSPQSLARDRLELACSPIV